MNTGLSLNLCYKAALNLKIHIFNLDMDIVAFLSVLGHILHCLSFAYFGFYFDTVIACKIALVFRVLTFIKLHT